MLTGFLVETQFNAEEGVILLTSTSLFLPQDYVLELRNAGLFVGMQRCSFRTQKAGTPALRDASMASAKKAFREEQPQRYQAQLITPEARLRAAANDNTPEGQRLKQILERRENK